MGLNEALFRWINHWPGSLAPAMRLFSLAWTYTWFKAFLIILIVAMIARGHRTRVTAIESIVAIVIANGWTDLFKNLAPVNRPFVEIPKSEMMLRLGEGSHSGTASAHSANMAAVAFVFSYHLGWYGLPWALLALLVGLSRVYNGVHYPSQVLLGWTCGLVSALVVTKTWEAYERRRDIVRANREPNVDQSA